VSDDANEPTPEESTLPAAEEADEAEPQPEQAPATEPVAEIAPTADNGPAAEPVETASIGESEPARRGTRATTPRSEMEAALEAIGKLGRCPP